MIAWPLSRVCDAVGGRTVSVLDGGARGVSIDTRTLRAGEIYVAIRGERYDGHDFIAEAVRRGAAAVISERDDGAAGVPAIRVADTRAALARLASAYRSTLAARVVAVTGSCGKTTTCRLIDAALGSRLGGTVSERSFNNDIGVPLTILRAHPDDAYLVCEVGTSGPGEIGPLSELVRPDVAVITMIGRAHLERLGDLDGVRREKAGIYRGLGAGGVALAPSADVGLAAFLPAGSATVGLEDHATHRVREVSAAEGGLSIEMEGRRYRVPLTGAHHAVNVAMAALVARWFGIEDTAMNRGFAGLRVPAMRYETRAMGGVTIVNDAYNANPESTIAALRTFAVEAVGATRRVVVLGDMLELGGHEMAAHAEVMGLAGSLGFDLVIPVGTRSVEAAARVLGGGAAGEVSLDGGGAARIAARLMAGDAVLLKGSRGVGLERVGEAWERLAGAGASA